MVLQIGVMYIWSYVYTIMRVSSSNSKSAEEAAIAGTLSADDPEMSYKEPLLHCGDDKSDEQVVNYSFTLIISSILHHSSFKIATDLK